MNTRSSDNDEEFEKLIALLPESQVEKVCEFINGLDGSSNVVEIVLGVGRDIEIRWRSVLEGGLRKVAIADTLISRKRGPLQPARSGRHRWHSPQNFCNSQRERGSGRREYESGEVLADACCPDRGHHR